MKKDLTQIQIDSLIKTKITISIRIQKIIDFFKRLK